MKKMRPVEVKLLALSPWVEVGKLTQLWKLNSKISISPPALPCLPQDSTASSPLVYQCWGVYWLRQSSCLPLALSHLHCFLPSAAGAVGNRQQRGPHSYPKAGYCHRGANKIQKNTDHSGYPVTHREGRKKWKEWYTVKVLATWGQANIIITIKLKMALHAVYRAGCSWEYRRIVLSVTIQGITCWGTFLHASRKETGSQGRRHACGSPRQASTDQGGETFSWPSTWSLSLLKDRLVCLFLPKFVF